MANGQSLLEHGQGQQGMEQNVENTGGWGGGVQYLLEKQSSKNHNLSSSFMEFIF
jgi:hypothetical protein